MKLVRTYPPLNPETLRGRNYVEDEIPRCYIDNYDNRPLLEFGTNLVVLEWDIAVSKPDLEIFCSMASERPDEVIVAPYLIPVDTGPDTSGTDLEGYAWVHRVVTNDATLNTRWVNSTDWECDLFGFGMVYLPWSIQKEFAEDKLFSPHDRRMTDTNFSIWHFRKYRKKVPIAWQTRPVHLHYHCPKEYPWK